MTSYSELHCHSNFSFLDGASSSEELAAEAARLGIDALAITDHDGFYGVVRFAKAAGEVGLKTIFGAELSIGLTKPQNGEPDPEGNHLVILARNPVGYANLSRAITEAQLSGGEKGRPRYSLEALSNAHGGQWLILTGCRKGAVPLAAVDKGPSAAAGELAHLINAFGRANVAVELWDHGYPIDSARNDCLAKLAVDAGVELVATNNVHYASPACFPLATALAAVRARRCLDEIDGWLPAAGTAHLQSGVEMKSRFRRYPGVVERTAEIGLDCAFDLALVAPNLPLWPVPDGYNEMSWLRQLTETGAIQRYGTRGSERVPGAYKQIDHELAIIDQLGFPGYFLIVHDIVEFCRRENIYCQGRGSAANSAVCFALGITNADAVGLKLLFERFLSTERDGPPDIDLDIESDRREEAIQYVYNRYGRENAAQVANVITYRPKSAVRDAGKALGFSPGQLDAWSKQVDGWEPLADSGYEIPDPVIDLAKQFQDFPRHLGIHSGGMVICDRPVVEVCPVEWGRMKDRSVLQWDKEDCAAAGLVKFDLLGLGMLSALHYAIDLIKDHHGVSLELATLPQDPAVYDMLCKADSIGVFQVESRAQMATLPRLKPRCFYDLVVEVALIRPGPIQGGSVHPYLRRRSGVEKVTYLHPLLEPSLKKTLGVPLFQEQLMQIAIDVAGFSPAEADELRQAMGSKRSKQRMAKLKRRLFDGMAQKGITGETAEAIAHKIEAFADFGFPESHSVSFAYLVYSSSWIKYHYPAAFLASLLNAQPMGFYSPQTLTADARRHGVKVLGPDLNASSAKATLEGGVRGGVWPPSHAAASQEPEHPPEEKGGLGGHRKNAVVRLGIGSVRHIGEELAKQIAGGRPYENMQELVNRVRLKEPQLEALATAGALGCFELTRRHALWAAGPVAQLRPGQMKGLLTGADAPQLPSMSKPEEVAADIWATGISPGHYPTQFIRDQLNEMGVVTASSLKKVPHGKRLKVGGIVTHRQKPATAKGTIFLNIEDETGLINVICSKGVWIRYKNIARSSPALIVKGRIERAEGVINIIAEGFERLGALGKKVAVPTKSRDFR